MNRALGLAATIGIAHSWAGRAAACPVDDLSWFGNGGSGGIVSTADGLLTVMRTVVGGTYLPADLTTAMLTPNQGSYGLGIGSYSLRCGVFFGHQGGVNG
ncbi:MAG TPA: hypothetical protein VFI69_10225, partial [Candidatus Limnocylindrales bacterium]|nr:hypothetical protein [Candidatus Limnocylindrales bacterium]